MKRNPLSPCGKGVGAWENIQTMADKMILRKWLHKDFLLKELEPVEIVAYLTLIIAVCLSVVFSLKFYVPSLRTSLFIYNHYFGPLVPSLMLSCAVIVISRYQSGEKIRGSLIINRIRIFIAFVISVYLHFNLKLWAQLINHRRYDSMYHMIDLKLSSAVSVISMFRMKIYEMFPFGTNAYHDVFVSMFILSFLLHALLNKKLEQVITATTVALTIGGITYSLAPAMGPFIFGFGINSTVTETQTHMWRFYQEFTRSNGLIYSNKYFCSAVAAMPSLHIANAAIFTFYALKEIPLLTIIYIPLLAYLVIDAIALRWHYLIDIPAGILLMILSVYITQFLYSFKKLNC